MDVRLIVSIPVRIGGNTGQRDAWEEYERAYNVTVEGDSVVLTDQGAGSLIGFSLAELQEAVEFRKDHPLP